MQKRRTAPRPELIYQKHPSATRVTPPRPAHRPAPPPASAPEDEKRTATPDGLSPPPATSTSEDLIFSTDDNGDEIILLPEGARGPALATLISALLLVLAAGAGGDATVPELVALTNVLRPVLGGLFAFSFLFTAFAAAKSS